MLASPTMAQTTRGDGQQMPDAGALHNANDELAAEDDALVVVGDSSEKPLQAVTLSEHGKAGVALELTAGRNRFRMPLSDKSISNDASIGITLH